MKFNKTGWTRLLLDIDFDIEKIDKVKEFYYLGIKVSKHRKSKTYKKM